MPARPMRPCTHPGCRRLSVDGRCPLHPRWMLRQPRTQRFYDSRRWRDHIRPSQLRRHPLCEECARPGHAVIATEVDHVDGDPTNNADTNLRSICKSCHSRKTVLQDGGFGRPRQQG